MNSTPRSGDAGRASPADDLADVWSVLDTLPRTTSSVDMAATTVTMVAAASAAPRGAGSRPRWLLPAVAACASLVTGVIAGRMTVADPDVRILEDLPLIRHVRALREAGTTTFLKALADRRLPPPPRPPRDAPRDEMREFEEMIRDLEADHAWGSAAQPLLKDRRAAIDALTADERDGLERAVAVFHALSTNERRQLAAVAAALADPARQNLREAARTWHRLITAIDPPGRRNIVELDEKGRLEWIDRRRLRDRDRRGPPPTIEGGPPRPPRPPGPGGPGGEGRPRWQGPRGDGVRGEAGPRGERGGPRPGEPRRDGLTREPVEPPP